MSAPTVAEAEAVNFETAFHLDKDVASEDPENYLVIHELMGRGQLLNAYEVSPLLLKNFSKHCILDPHARACIVAGRARAPARVSARPFPSAIFFSIRPDSASFSVVFLPTPGEDGASVRPLPPHDPRICRLDAPRGRRALYRARFSLDLDSHDPFPGPS